MSNHNTGVTSFSFQDNPDDGDPDTPDTASEKMRDVFDEIVGGYENSLSLFLRNSTYDDGNANTAPDNTALAMDYSAERLALLSLQYNDNPSAVQPLLSPGNDLSVALETDNGTRAWFEISYVSNANSEDGVATRRYIESQIFGLYDDPGNVSQAEADSVIDFLLAPYAGTGFATNFAKILDYENNHSEAGYINSKAKVDGTDFNDQLGYGDIFKPIANRLIERFGNLSAAEREALGLNINGEVVLGLGSQWQGANPDPTPILQPFYRVYYGLSPRPGESLTTSLDFNNDGVMENYSTTGINDLLMVNAGADTLYGGYHNEDTRTNKDEGNDVLFGLGGNDHLHGHRGNDQLHGGAGNDNYYFNYGDGNDVIFDTEVDGGTNTIHITHTNGGTQTTIGQLRRLAPGSNIYQEVDGNDQVVNPNTVYTLHNTDDTDPDNDNKNTVYSLLSTVNSKKQNLQQTVVSVQQAA